MISGWYRVLDGKTKEDLLEIIYQDEKKLNHKVLDICVKEDHIWLLTEFDNQNVVRLYPFKKEDEGFSYMSCSDEDGLICYDIPKDWIKRITDIEERKKNFPGRNYDNLEEWLNRSRWFNGFKIKEYEHQDMEVIKYAGEVKKLKHLIVSDPHYGKDVKCRYDKKFSHPDNWKVNLYIVKRNYYDEYRGHKLHITGFDINLLLVEREKKNFIIKLNDDGSIVYSKFLRKREYDIGVDTAQVALGINENASEILEYYNDYNNATLKLNDYRPYFSLETLEDGFFGIVREYKYLNDYYGIFINGWLSGDTKYDEEMIKEYFEERFQIQNMKKIENEQEKSIEL